MPALFSPRDCAAIAACLYGMQRGSNAVQYQKRAYHAPAGPLEPGGGWGGKHVQIPSAVFAALCSGKQTPIGGQRQCISSLPLLREAYALRWAAVSSLTLGSHPEMRPGDYPSSQTTFLHESRMGISNVLGCRAMLMSPASRHCQLGVGENPHVAGAHGVVSHQLTNSELPHRRGL